MILELLKPNIDSFGLVAQANGDGGDSFQREGMVIIAAQLLANKAVISQDELNKMLLRYEMILVALEVDEYYSFRRHKDTTKWYGQTDRMSRDQLIPNIVGMGIGKHSGELIATLIMLISRFGFTTNIRDNFVDDSAPKKLPDFCGPSIFGAFIRALNLKLLKPLLILSDIELLINSIIIRRRIKKDPSQSDINSQLVLLIQSQMVLSTFVSRLAVKVLAKMTLCNPPTYTGGQLLSQFGPQTALDSYFDKNQSGGAPQINELFRPVLEDVLCVK